MALQPFQLRPDPAFFFASRQHQAALAALRRGLDAGAEFILMSGDIGAGKTLVVRTLLEGLDARRIVSAQVCNTQLDAPDLLRATATAFGVVDGFHVASGVELHLMDFIVKLARSGRRALLVIDEAQHLSAEALETLQVLTRIQPYEQTVLQVALVGQTEMRDAFGAMFCAGVEASCHLGPLGDDEAEGYILHRLTKAGWRGSPAFPPAAAREVAHRSGGTPRRMNLLCNRLLMTALAEGHSRIDVGLVTRVADALRDEFEAPAPLPALAMSPSMGSRRRGLVHRASPAAQPALWCVLGGQGDCIRAAPLLRALRQRGGLPEPLLVRALDNHALERHRGLFDAASRSIAPIALGVSDGSSDTQAQVGRRFEALLARGGPSAVIVFGGSRSGAACAAVADEWGIPVIRTGAHKPAEGEVARGNLVVDAVRLASSMLGLPFSPGHSPARRRSGYGLIALHRRATLDDMAALAAVCASLCEASAVMPLLWPVHRRTADRLPRHGGRVHTVPMLAYPDFVRLLGRAACVLTDSATVHTAAASVGTPCVRLDPERSAREMLQTVLAPGFVPEPLPATWDGHAAEQWAEIVAVRLQAAPMRIRLH